MTTYFVILWDDSQVESEPHRFLNLLIPRWRTAVILKLKKAFIKQLSVEDISLKFARTTHRSILKLVGT